MLPNALPFFVLASLLVIFSSETCAQRPEARAEVRLDQVYQQYDLSGRGAVVAMIERGIDYRHPDFIDEEGHTRIAFLYDMLDPSGANDPDNPYGIGSIFTAEEINQNLQSGGEPLSTDRFGHGTACTGIAAGNGSAVAGTDFQGVAPEATLIVVKVNHDPFPAFGDQPGQTGFFNPTYIPIALEFVADKLEELDLPGVALINLGSIGGPTDGTSTIARAMNAFVERGHTLICGVGDDGGADNHASTTVKQDSTVELRIQKAGAGNLRLDLWYPEADRYEVSIRRPNGTLEGPFPAPTTRNSAADENLGDIRMFHRGADSEFSGATSERRQLLIDFSGPAGEYAVLLRGTTASGDSVFHASLNPSRLGNSENAFLTHVVPGYSVNDYASADKVIVPTDYVVDNTWTDIDGVERSRTGQGDAGEIWLGSSLGPTHDGRLGVDVASPGEVLFGAYSPDTWYHSFRFNQVQGGEGNYGLQTAVSAAAPLLMGVVALMLEENPALGPQEIRSILRSTARTDSFTGSVPNTTWGYGKLDALAAVEAARLTVSTQERKAPTVEWKLFPNPATHRLNYRFSELPDLLVVENSWGQEVRRQSTPDRAGSISLAGLPAGIYRLRAKGENWNLIQLFLKQ